MRVANGAGSWALVLGWILCAAQATAEPAATLTHGPMVGGASDTQMRVWARTSTAAPVHVCYGEQADTLDKRSPVAHTSADHDYTGWVELHDLKPGTRYHYQVFVADAAAGPQGSFRTWPAARPTELNPKGLFNLRFEFGCCNNQTHSPAAAKMPTYTTLLKQEADKVDFAILDGDWLYEEARDYSPAAWLAQAGLTAAQTPPVVRHAPTIVGVWENYKRYMARPANLAQWHRQVPSFYTFDDHELVNDIVACGEAGLCDRRAVFRDMGVRAWFDYLGWSNPVEHSQPVHFGQAHFKSGSDILVDAQSDLAEIDLEQAGNLHVHWGTPEAGEKDLRHDHSPGNPNAGVYDIVERLDAHRLRIHPPARADGQAAYSIGRRSYGAFRVSNCEFYLLDTRSHRGLHDVRQPDKPGLTMLGLTQRRWLMERMRASDADFHFVVSSVNFMIPHLGGGGAKFDVNNKDDAWTAFLDERETLIDFWDSLGKPVFILTGDLHNSFAIKVTDRVWEFASGPHNSVNHPLADEGGRPINGRYQFGPRPCEIRWSSFYLDDVPRHERRDPLYCVVQVNNVANNPTVSGQQRWVAYPKPQVMFQFFDGVSGEVRYVETISQTDEAPLVRKSWSPRNPNAP